MFSIGVDEILEEGLDLTWEEEPPSVMAYLQNLSHIDFGLETPLRGKAKVWKTGKSIMIKGDVQTTLRLQCVRCLKDFSHPLSSDFDLTLHPLENEAFQEEMELKADEMEATFFEGEMIHLSEIACEQIFLEIPYTPLCREECQGLCPVCGKDRNVSACHCVQEDLESGFSALKKLKLH